jgi:hypothetical protein
MNNKENKKLKIKGSFEDVLKLSVKDNPKPKPKNKKQDKK